MLITTTFAAFELSKMGLQVEISIISYKFKKYRAAGCFQVV